MIYELNTEGQRPPRMLRRLLGGALSATVLGGLIVTFIPDPRVIVTDFEDQKEFQKDWLVDSDPSCRITLSSSDVVAGGRALKVQAPEGSRCEIVPRVFGPLAYKFLREPFHEERVYSFSVLAQPAAAGESDDLRENTVIAQWHASPDPYLDDGTARGPPLALRIHDGKWGITYGWDSNPMSKSGYLANNWQWVGALDTGSWVDWEFQVTWSYQEDGLVKVFKDRQLVFRREGPNAYRDLRGVYMKIGVYHPFANTTIFLDRLVVRGRADVMGDELLTP